MIIRSGGRPCFFRSRVSSRLGGVGAAARPDDLCASSGPTKSSLRNANCNGECRSVDRLNTIYFGGVA